MPHAPTLNPLTQQTRRRQRGAILMTVIGFVTLVAFVAFFGFDLTPVPTGGRTVDNATLEQLSLKGFNLTEGWSLLPQDQVGWTPSALPTQGWQSIEDMARFDAGEWDGRGWFRLPLEMAPDVTQHGLALLTTQYGAMEIYLNDELLHATGEFPSAGSKGRGVAVRFDAPVLLPDAVDSGDELLVHIDASRLRHQLPVVWQPMNQTHNPAGFTLSIGHLGDAEALVAARHRNNALLLLAGFTLLVLGFYHSYFHVMSRSMPTVRQYAVFAVLAGLSSLLWYATNAQTPLALLIPVYLARFLLMFAGSFVGLHIIMELYEINRVKVLIHGFAATVALLLAGLLAGIEGHGAAMLLFGVLTTTTLIWARIQHTSYIGFIMFGFHGHIVAPLYWLFTYRLWVPGPITMEAFTFLGGGVTYLILAFILASRHAALEREREATYMEMLALTDQAQALEDLVAQRKQAHDQLSSFNQQLHEQLVHQTRDRLQAERQAAFGQVVQGIVHNLKGPLTTVSGNTDILGLQHQQLTTRLDGDDPLDLRPVVDSMGQPISGLRTGSDRLESMVHSLLDRSRTDQASTATRFDLNDMIKAEIEFIRADKRLKAVHIEVNLADGPLPVTAVRAEIAQVFENLVGNARDALHGTEGATIKVSTARRNGMPCFEVADNGPGIPSEIADKVFDPFFTTKPTAEENPDKDSPVGTGLGLWMCKRSIEENAGNVSLYNSPLGGALFCVALPEATRAA